MRTPRHRREALTGTTSALAREDVPLLASFFRGYLHQDFVEEHGSAEEAARAFRRDASEQERLVLSREIGALVARLRHLDVVAVGHVLIDELGSAWAPVSRSELKHVLESLQGKMNDSST